MAFKIIPMVGKVTAGKIRLTLDAASELVNSSEEYTLQSGNHSEAYLVHAIISKDNGKSIKTIHLKDKSAHDDEYVQDDINSDKDFVYQGAGFDALLGSGIDISSFDLYSTTFYPDGYYEVTILIFCEQIESTEFSKDSGVGSTFFLNGVLESVHKMTIYDQTTYPKEFFEVEKSMKANVLITSLEIAGTYKKQLIFDKHLAYLKKLIL